MEGKAVFLPLALPLPNQQRSGDENGDGDADGPLPPTHPSMHSVWLGVVKLPHP